MTLDDFLQNFAYLSGDAIGVSFRKWEDEYARIVWINPAFTCLFGYSEEEILGKAPQATLHPDPLDEIIEVAKDRFDRGDMVFNAEAYARHKDGSAIWVSMSVAAAVSNESRGRFSAAIYRDLTALKTRERRAEKAVAENAALLDEAIAAQARLLNAINAMPDPVAIWDKEFRLVTCNSAFAPRLLGRDGEVAVGTPVEDVLSEASRGGQFVDAIGREEAWRRQAIAELRAGPIRHRTEYTDGRVFNANSHSAPYGDTLVLTMDVTELERQRAKLENYAAQLELANDDIRQQALHDDLTGMPNRRLLTERLTALARQETGWDEGVAALQIDFDRFKHINDTMGHAAGDHVLIHVAGRLKRVAEEAELVARIGGDEFIVLTRCRLGDVGPERLAERIVADLARPVPFRGKELRIGASVGVARTPLSNFDDLLTDADIALYKAKDRGRARVACFEQDDADRMRAQKVLSDDILRGLEKSEFVPFFQPRLDAGSDRVVVLKALARWRHPTRGILGPDAFLSAAEELNVLHLIDGMIFDKALDECQGAFPYGDSPGLALNVGQSRVMGPNILKAAKVASAYSGPVAFELLETIYLDEGEEAFLMQLDAIRDAGVTIEVDDFGSGRASIVALQKISPDRLKIDRRLVAPIVSDKRSRRLVRSIVDIGHALNIGVTAEGVETQAHSEILASLGCDRLQGYHIARPAPLADLIARFEFSYPRPPRITSRLA